MFDFRRGRPLREVARTFLLMTTIVVAAPASAVRADDTSEQIQSLRREVETLRKRDEENRARMAEMERLLRDVLEARGAAAAPGAANAVPGDTRPAGPAADPAASASTATGADSPEAALDRALADSAPVAVPATGDRAPAPSAGTPASPSAPTVMAGTGARRGDVASATIGGGAAQARLIDIAFSTLVAAGGSSVGDHALGDLEGGAHDPNRNGFTLQQGELSLTGAVDPYFSGEAHIVATPDGVELEEAFLTTSALPLGLQVEAGYSLTEFGLLNPTHAHAWDWLDQPVVNTRMFGGEGLRSPGARLAWLIPVPFFAELHAGVQNANEGDFTASFMATEGIGGRPAVERDVRGFDDLLWLVRANAAWDLTGESALLLGASGLYGPNQTGSDGETWIYGVDAKVRWRPASSFRGWPFVLWQTEAIGRSYHADGFVAGTEIGGGDDGHGHGHDEEEEDEEPEFPNDLASDTLEDYGFYSQLLVGFRYGWAAGFRAEYVTGSGAGIAGGVPDTRANDPLRDDRLRLAPLLVWHPTEFSRLRLQYNYDDADHLAGGDAHTVWLGAEILYGKHAAHKY
jgi:hypothetical protein